MEKDNLMKNLTNTTVKKIEENLFTDKQKSQKEKKKRCSSTTDRPEAIRGLFCFDTNLL
jgi:hypothetical protein